MPSICARGLGGTIWAQPNDAGLLVPRLCLCAGPARAIFRTHAIEWEWSATDGFGGTSNNVDKRPLILYDRYSVFDCTLDSSKLGRTNGAGVGFGVQCPDLLQINLGPAKNSIGPRAIAADTKI